MKAILWTILKLFYRLSVKGSENLPAKGPVVLVANHASYLDPIVLGVASRRPVDFMAKEELFKIFGLGWLMRRLYAFPVKRTAFDRRAIRTALKALAAGRVVGIFPQGTRQKDGVGEAFPGAALLALKSAAPIVPAAIVGTGHVMPDGAKIPRWPRLAVRFGPAIRPPAGADNIGADNIAGDKKEVVTQLTDRILAELRDLLGES